MLGQCLIKHWSKTQSTISLSSGEAELHAIATGCAQALGLQSLLRDLGWEIEIKVLSDATAAIGIARRKGLGKVRHLDCTDLWVQDKIRSQIIQLEKTLGAENIADILTKYVDKATLDKALRDGTPQNGRKTSKCTSRHGRLMQTGSRQGGVQNPRSAWVCMVVSNQFSHFPMPLQHFP